MTKFKLMAAAAVVTALAAGPAMAKDAKHHSDKQSAKVHKAGKQARAPSWRNDRAADVRYGRRYDGRESFERNLNRSSTTTFYDDRGYDSGFWPGAVAADVVGGAIGTADAIASAPFRDTYAYDSRYDDSYAYTPAPVYRSNWDNGWNTNAWDNNWNNNWARRQAVQEGGFVCTPGSTYTNSYGYTQLCQ